MKSAIVTGVAGGMGHAAARRLIEDGFAVFGLDIHRPEELPGMTFIKADLTDAASVEEARRQVAASTEQIDCIVNLAGMYDLGSLVEMDEAEFLRIFDVNLFAVYRVNKAFLPLLGKGGRVLITSSELAPLDPLPFTGIYGVTKAAVEKYAYSLRMELQLLGCRVIVLRPGAVDTGLLDVSTKRLGDFCAGTTRYACNAQRFRRIVDRVEARKVPPEKVAALISRALGARRPRYVYKINRNPLLLLLSALPDHWQCGVIKKLLTAR